MAKTLNDLADSFEAKARNLPIAASRAAVAVGTVIITDLANVTPVDTSRALSNWIVTLSNKSNRSIFPHVPGYFGYTAAASIAVTIAQAKDIMSKKKPGQTIFITNNLRYIQDLNDGKSAQEPAGFVERGVLKGRLVVRSYKLNL